MSGDAHYTIELSRSFSDDATQYTQLVQPKQFYTRNKIKKQNLSKHLQTKESIPKQPFTSQIHLYSPLQHHAHPSLLPLGSNSIN